MHRLLLLAAVGLLGLSACAPRQARPSKEGAAPRGEEGMASWYGPGLHGRKTASGERFDKEALTAAHRRFPFGTCVRVVNLATQKEVQVRVNDRGPFAKGRILDLSEAAARRLGMIERGHAKVRLLPCG
jgi:rare lipoprotein A